MAGERFKGHIAVWFWAETGEEADAKIGDIKNSVTQIAGEDMIEAAFSTVEYESDGRPEPFVPEPMVPVDGQ